MLTFFLQSIFNENPSELIERDHLTYASLDQRLQLEAAQAFLQDQTNSIGIQKIGKTTQRKNLSA